MSVVLTVDDRGVAEVRLNRPDELNILNLEMRDALIEAIGAVYDHPDVRAVVLSAAGKHFSAGADISEFGGAEDIVERRRIRWDRDPWGPLWDIAVPVVAALHGYTLAAGLEMAMLCDLRLATVDTKLGLPETKLGMLPAAGGTQSLTKAIGPHVALPIVLTGASIGADEALRLGIVDRIVEDSDAAARDLAGQLAQCDRRALAAAKRALRAAVDLPLPLGLQRERDLSMSIGQR